MRTYRVSYENIGLTVKAYDREHAIEQFLNYIESDVADDREQAVDMFLDYIEEDIAIEELAE